MFRSTIFVDGLKELALCCEGSVMAGMVWVSDLWQTFFGKWWLSVFSGCI